MPHLIGGYRGDRDNEYIKYDQGTKGYTVEWHLCDGTIVKSDSIPINSINCGGNESNMIVKDASGNVVYTENIASRMLTNVLNPDQTSPSVKLYPNPVRDVLNVHTPGTA